VRREAGEAVAHDGVDEPRHAAEVGVDRHRRGADLAGQPPRLQRLRPFGLEHPHGSVEQAFACPRERLTRCHNLVMFVDNNVIHEEKP
jgi:hypothetical protein